MKVTSWKSAAPTPEPEKNNKTEKQDRHCIFYLNTETGDYKAYTSIKSLCIDKPQFVANTISHHFMRNDTNVYTKGAEKVFKAKLHTYR